MQTASIKIPTPNPSGMTYLQICFLKPKVAVAAVVVAHPPKHQPHMQRIAADSGTTIKVRSGLGSQRIDAVRLRKDDSSAEESGTVRINKYAADLL
jgi:hypothetical protein